MDDDALLRLIGRIRAQATDDGTCEVKACGHGLGSSVWDTVSAFANTGGGVLVLGLSEDAAFAAAPGFDPDRVVDQLVAGMGDGGGQGRLTMPPAYNMERHQLEGAPVLVVHVLENEIGSKPCYVTAKGLQGGSYRRVDDKDIRLSATEIFEMQRALAPQESDRGVVEEADAHDLDDEVLEALIRARIGSKALRGVGDRQQQLVRLNVLTKPGGVRLAGLLVAGSYPQQFVPRLLIDVAVHPSNEKSGGASGLRFLDRVLCEGPLAGAIDQAVGAVTRNLRTYSVVSGSSRDDRLEIPEEVLREAIANAVLHREYHELFRGQPVTVDVHPNRVVVTSPGGLWGGKTIDNLDDGVSRCRNQTLMQLLQSVPLSGGGLTVEGQGGGIKTMIHEMEAHALDRPRFRATPDQVTVELRRHGAEIPELRSWLRDLTDRELSVHEDAALVMARREGEVGVLKLRDDLRIDSDEAREVLADLVALGLLRPDGPDAFVLWGHEPGVGPAETALLAALSTEVPRGIHDIADRLGKTPGSLRPLLRRLVEVGRVTATAPPTSRSRKYLRAT